jgi:hypothetical protein
MSDLVSRYPSDLTPFAEGLEAARLITSARSVRFRNNKLPLLSNDQAESIVLVVGRPGWLHLSDTKGPRLKLLDPVGRRMLMTVE